ncbi:MAG: sulfurtransferase TusA family protein [Chloroflexota bacterium]|nr:sulfurtransferase TusA family protein [Chloroflexota bacterium]
MIVTTHDGTNEEERHEAASDPGGQGDGTVVEMTSQPLPQPDAVLEGLGEACATLTPLIWRRIRKLESGQVLAVVTDDPAAPDGVAAWSRLTGNELIVRIDEEGGRSRFYLRRK